MLFRLALLVSLAWHAAFCVAGGATKLSTELFLSDNQHRWATVSVDGGKSIFLSDPYSEKPSFPYAKCDDIQALRNRALKPEPTDCRLEVGCDDGHRWLPCLLHARHGGHKILKNCGKIDEKKLKQDGVTLLDCDTTLNPAGAAPENTEVSPPKDVAIPIQSNGDLGAIKQIVLSLPEVPDHSKAYRTSRRVGDNARTEIIPCNELPTKRPRPNTKRCVLSVYCVDETGERQWRTCVAHFPRDNIPSGRSGSLGHCGQEPPNGLEPCTLDGSFKEGQSLLADENEC